MDATQYTAEKIQQTIAQALPGATVKVTDTTGTNDHFDCLVIWDGFETKSLVEQHQIVMGFLKEGLKGPIHALSLKTATRTNWEQRR